MPQGLLFRHLIFSALLVSFSPHAAAYSADIFVGGAIGEGTHKRFRAQNVDTVDTLFDPGFTVTTNRSVRGGDDKSNFAWRVFGGAWLHSHFGIQFEYVDLGHTSYSENTSLRRDVQFNFGSPRVILAPSPFGANFDFDTFSKASLTGIAALAKTRYPITRKLNLELNLGAVRWDFKGQSRGSGSFVFQPPVTITTNSQGGGRFRDTQRELGYDAVYGFSVDYELSKTFSLGFDWIRYELGPLDEHADFLGASFKYQFTLGSPSLKEQYHRESTPLADAIHGLWTQNIIARKLPGWTTYLALAPGWGLRNSGAEGEDNEVVEIENDLVFSRQEFTSVKKIDKQSFIGKAEIGTFFSSLFWRLNSLY